MRLMESKERRCGGAAGFVIKDQGRRGEIAGEERRCRGAAAYMTEDRKRCRGAIGSTGEDRGYCRGAAGATSEGRERRLVVATRFWDRLQGFLVPRPLACVLLISPCSSIHTFGMKAALDVAFFDKEGSVLRSERSVEPEKVVRCKDAVGVLEQMSDDRNEWYREGEEVVLYV